MPNVRRRDAADAQRHVDQTISLPVGDSQLARDLIGDRVNSVQQFIHRLESYDSKSDGQFRLIILLCISSFGLSARRLAELCRANRATIVRWTKDSLPTELARIEIVKRIRNELRARLDETKTRLPVQVTGDADREN